MVVWRKVERFGEYEITVEYVNRFSPSVRANDIVVRFRNVFPIDSLPPAKFDQMGWYRG